MQVNICKSLFNYKSVQVYHWKLAACVGYRSPLRTVSRYLISANKALQMKLASNQDPINQGSKQECQEKFNTTTQEPRLKYNIYIPSPYDPPPLLFLVPDGCTFEDESEETFNEQEADQGAFWIISWSISTPQRKWHCEGLWSDKQHLFRKRTEEGVDTWEEISRVSFQGLSGPLDRNRICGRALKERKESPWRKKNPLSRIFVHFKN